VVGAAEEKVVRRRIIITGAGGRLGAALAREWRAAGEDVTGFARQELDLSQPDQLRATLEPLDFAVLVNCAAQTNVDRCETHPDEAKQINADAVRVLAEICTKKGARCIQISTDYVFDGAKVGAYTEEDAALPISHYGASKKAGETALLEVSDKHLAVRVSWVFGPDRPSFVDQILQRARTEESVAAIADKIAVPTYTLDAAHLLRPLLFQKPVGGLLHLCNGGQCTWQEYGQFALDCAAEAGMELKARTVGALKMADLKAFIAKRPPNTAMSTDKLASIIGEQPRAWREAVREYVSSFVSLSSKGC
jgi:dTDP-4-dehydrorhamnose reductase